MEPAGSDRLKGCHGDAKDIQISHYKTHQVCRTSYHSTLNLFEFSRFWPAFDQLTVFILQHNQDLQALLNLGYRPLETIPELTLLL